MIAIDGKTLRGTRLGDGRQVHLLSALDTTTGIVIARRQTHLLVQVKGNQPTLFKQLKRLPRAQIPVAEPDPRPSSRPP